MDSVYKNMFHSLLAEILHTGQDEDRNALAQFRREVAALLEPGETVEAVCGYGPCAAVTNRRFLVTTRRGIDSVPFSQIQCLRGLDPTGNRTFHPGRMMVLAINANKQYKLSNHGRSFEQVAQKLYAHVQGNACDPWNTVLTIRLGS